VGELLRTEPGNLRAHRLLIDLLLKDGSHRAAVEAANRMAAAAAASGGIEVWHETRGRLRDAGFLVVGDEVKAPPADVGSDAEEFELLETGGPEPPMRPPAMPAPDDDIFDLLPAAAEPPIELGGAAFSPAGPAGPPGIEQENVEFVVVDDGEFADLAAEVEREMETAGAEPLTEAEAPSVEEIVASFKQGVAENLSPEDYDTHYNLGIAYREMGLTDEAIGEFEIAVKSRDYLIGCCSLLGLCSRDKGEFETAMQWYKRGLQVPDILDQEKHALLYELGEAYEAAGDLEAARAAFAEISLNDDSYRDVGVRLAALN
jgi:tetratricopeptide (TPR) repeat protein